MTSVLKLYILRHTPMLFTYGRMENVFSSSLPSSKHFRNHSAFEACEFNNSQPYYHAHIIYQVSECDLSIDRPGVPY